MIGQSSWSLNRRRYGDAYRLHQERGGGVRRNLNYPEHNSHIRPPRRGGSAAGRPSRIRNEEINGINRCKEKLLELSERGGDLKDYFKGNNAKIEGELKPIRSCKSPPQIPRLYSKNSSSMVDLSPSGSSIIKTESSDMRSESSVSFKSRFRGVKTGESRRNCEVVQALSARGAGIWPEGVSEELRVSQDGNNYPLDTGKAASLVCRALVINAWRRRRDENFQLNDTIGKLSEQVDHLHIQIVVLRRLLDAENGRVGKFMNDIQRVKVQIEEVVRERDKLKLEKESAVEDFEKLKNFSEQNNVVTENLRNELFNAKNQLRAIDEQINKEREKLLKLREDKKILIDKVATSEALASERLAKAEIATATAEDLRAQLNAHVALLATAHEQQQRSSKEVKLKTEETMRMEKKLQTSKESAKMLSTRTVNLENELSNRDAALRRLESAYNAQLSELTDLRERFARQSQDGGWSNRVLQIAGSVVRAPRAILRTLSYLSNPSESEM